MPTCHRQGQNGDIEIWTSTYTLAEVFKRKCGDDRVGVPDNKDYIFEEFLDQDFVVYAQVDSDVGQLARRLLRRFEELKKPPDAVHLATAIIHNCDEMHTTDGENLLPLNGRISRLDKKPLLICRPPHPPPPTPAPVESEELSLGRKERRMLPIPQEITTDGRECHAAFCTRCRNCLPRRRRARTAGRP